MKSYKVLFLISLIISLPTLSMDRCEICEKVNYTTNVIPLSVLRLNNIYANMCDICAKEPFVIKKGPFFFMDTSDTCNDLDTIDVKQGRKFIVTSFTSYSEYASQTREQLEKIVEGTVNNNIDLNTTKEIKQCDWTCEDFPRKYKNYNVTLLGHCLFKKKHDSSGCVLADILVSNGAKLSGSYDNKFGFYFIKKISHWYMDNYDIRTPTTKIFETLLYRRVQYCAQKSNYIYLIAQRIKNKALYPNLATAIPKFVLDHIAHFIISDGVSDVMNVCKEEASATYNEGNKPYTMLSLWERWYARGDKDDCKWKPELKPLDAREWDKDFDEFMRQKRNKEWQPGNSNLIIRSLRYKQGSLYQDSEFTEMR